MLTDYSFSSCVIKVIAGLREMLQSLCHKAMILLRQEARRTWGNSELTDEDLQPLYKEYESSLCSETAERFALFHSNGNTLDFGGEILRQMVNCLLHSPVGGFAFSAVQLMRSLLPLWAEHWNTKSSKIVTCGKADLLGAGTPLLTILQTEVSSQPLRISITSA
jgi:hypothetical protein